MADNKTFTFKIDGVDKAYSSLKQIKDEISSVRDTLKSSSDPTVISSLTNQISQLEIATRAFKVQAKEAALTNTDLASSILHTKESIVDAQIAARLALFPPGSIEHNNALIAQLNETMKEASPASDAYIQAKKKVEQLNLVQTELQKTAHQQQQEYIQLGQSIIGTFGNGLAALQSFSGANKEYAAVIAKVQQIQALVAAGQEALNLIRQISIKLDTQKAISNLAVTTAIKTETIAVTASTAATNALGISIKTALGPIGLIIAALGTLTIVAATYRTEADKAIQLEEDLIIAADQHAKSVKDLSFEFESLLKLYQNGVPTQQETVALAEKLAIAYNDENVKVKFLTSSEAERNKLIIGARSIYTEKIKVELIWGQAMALNNLIIDKQIEKEKIKYSISHGGYVQMAKDITALLPGLNILSLFYDTTTDKLKKINAADNDISIYTNKINELVSSLNDIGRLPNALGGDTITRISNTTTAAKSIIEEFIKEIIKKFADFNETVINNDKYSTEYRLQVFEVYKRQRLKELDGLYIIELKKAGTNDDAILAAEKKHHLDQLILQLDFQTKLDMLNDQRNLNNINAQRKIDQDEISLNIRALNQIISNENLKTSVLSNAIRKRTDIQLKLLESTYQQQRTIVEQQRLDSARSIDNEFQTATTAADLRAMTAFAAAEKAGTDLNTVEENYQKDKAKIRTRFEEQIIENEHLFNQMQINNEYQNNLDIIDINKQKYAELNKLKERDRAAIQKQMDEEDTRRAISLQKFKQGAIDIANALKDLYGYIVAFENQENEIAIKALDARKTQLDAYISDLDSQLDGIESRINALSDNLSKANIEQQDKIIAGIEAERKAQISLQKQKQIALEEEKRIAAEKRKLQLEEFERNKNLAEVQAVVQGSVAIVQALAAGPIIGEILAAIIAAQVAVQIATIEASQPNFAEGGYTGIGNKYDIAGVVHKDEYVIPKSIVNSPIASPLIQQLEVMRTGGFAEGGYTTIGSPNMESIIAQQTDLIKKTIDLSERPIIVDVREVTSAQDNIKKVISRAAL